MKETRIRTTKDGMPDVYDEASAQQLPNLVFLAGGFAVFIGGQAILGEEGTLAVARWLNEGPIGPLWKLLAQPIVARKEVTDAAGTVYESTLAPTGGFAVIVVYSLARAAQRRIARAARDSASPGPDNEANQ
mmetsp:Transcript_67375/g.177657  ORF Transcript_67375/g.177657 Transcript_67375/m.177657 type:complete len:132 (-) Transcript_67375:278-673(-)